MDCDATPEEAAHFLALQLAQWFYDAKEITPDTPADLTNTAAEFEHYLTNGETVAFDCKDSARKFVRGATDTK